MRAAEDVVQAAEAHTGFPSSRRRTKKRDKSSRTQELAEAIFVDTHNEPGGHSTTPPDQVLTSRQRRRRINKRNLAKPLLTGCKKPGAAIPLVRVSCMSMGLLVIVFDTFYYRSSFICSEFVHTAHLP